MTILPSWAVCGRKKEGETGGELKGMSKRGGHSSIFIANQCYCGLGSSNGVDLVSQNKHTEPLYFDLQATQVTNHTGLTGFLTNLPSQFYA